MRRSGWRCWATSRSASWPGIWGSPTVTLRNWIKQERAERGERVEKHLLLTRYDPARAARGEMLKTEDILEILSIPLLGIIPESEEVLRASNVGNPVTLNSPHSAPARAYFDAARRLQGESLDVVVPTERRGIFGKLFGRRVA